MKNFCLKLRISVLLTSDGEETQRDLNHKAIVRLSLGGGGLHWQFARQRGKGIKVPPGRESLHKVCERRGVTQTCEEQDGRSLERNPGQKARCLRVQAEDFGFDASNSGENGGDLR